MAPVWTSEQKKVIELHNRNILVSAAAGSGKTAVLVQRIIEMISDDKHPVDVDRLVIVTFTNAAAAEMRQRILDAIEVKMEQEPENLHLRRQQTLINHAQITTIDSFCLNIIRNYFSEIDMDPGFKVADNGELTLLMADVMDEVIEEYYNGGRTEFYDFVDCYTPEKTDARLGDYIMQLYNAAQSNPWPKEWLSKCLADYRADSVEEFMESDVVRYITDEVKCQLGAIREMIGEMQEVIEGPDGPYMYADAINDDMLFVERAVRAGSITECMEIIGSHGFARLSAKKDANVSQESKDCVKNMRDVVKKALGKIADDYGTFNPQEMYELSRACLPFMEIYVEMTISFMDRLEEKKRKKNLITFSDMEHLALEILVKKNGDILEYTHVADELSRRYEEILIDEYQDSNLVQELILNSVSKERFGKPNVFMVGDVKQSIYRFRLARPELFIEKYDAYLEEDSLYQKIELHNNFRSRASVLSSVNEVFEKIMKKEFGQIQYDDNARLYAAATFPECEKDIGKTEVLLLEHEEETDMTDLEAEAVMCGSKIRELVGNEEYQVFDKETGGYRKVKYSDIVILMRSVKQNADIFVNTLAQMGIPALTESETGYFDAYEIAVLINMLNIIDNPMQDVPLVSVLKSYFGGFSSNELAQIKSHNKDKSFYDAFVLETGEKAENFLVMLEKFRTEAEYKAIHELIWDIAYDTGYYDYVGSMPMGKERQANIDMLIERAKSYEKTSFHGLFNFVRYIEKMKTYDVDYGEAVLNSENDNVVRITTIHKSKGLEFPVVFLTGCQKQFNNRDAVNKVVIDQDLCVGLDYFDCKSRIRRTTAVKKAIASKIRLANLSEEQRVLYVALTRAKEKLFVTGCLKKAETQMAKWQADAGRKRLTYLDVTSQRSYLDMIMPSALSENGSFSVHVVQTEAFLRMCEAMALESQVKSEQVKEIIREEKEAFAYPYRIISMPVKMTVSELKYLGQHVDDENSKMLIEEEAVPTVPKFISGETEVVGAARGSAYHKIMELLDFEKCIDEPSAREFVEKCVQEGRISREWADSINVKDIVKLLKSQFGQELKKAMSENKLYRERQFVMGIPADIVDEMYNKDEMILVQGIVDVYYETDEGIVLADYKTDSVPSGETGMQKLTERYKSQLGYYKIALEQLTGKKVVKKIIYSFKLGKEILL